MTYKNIKTGAVIDTKGEIHGDNWEPVKQPAPKPKKPR